MPSVEAPIETTKPSTKTAELLELLKEKKVYLAAGAGLLIISTLIIVFASAKKPKKGNAPSPKPTKSSSRRNNNNFNLPTDKAQNPPVSEAGQDIKLKINKDKFSSGDLADLASVYTQANEKQLKEKAVEKSIVIQEAAKQKLILIDEKILEPEKNWSEYNKIYKRAKETIVAQEEQISAQAVFIYFQNQFPPAIGIKKAKQLTRSKMEAIRKSLTTGEITFTQAAEIIKADSSLATIDPIYKENAYTEIFNHNKSRQIVDGITPENNQLLWSLKKGELSPIMLGYETGNAPQPNEAYWAIFKIIDKKSSGPPYLEWLKQKKQEYEI